MDGFEFYRRYDSLALGATLSKWFGDHFRTEDAKLHEALSRKR